MLPAGLPPLQGSTRQNLGPGSCVMTCNWKGVIGCVPSLHTGGRRVGNAVFMMDIWAMMINWREVVTSVIESVLVSLSLTYQCPEMVSWVWSCLELSTDVAWLSVCWYCLFGFLGLGILMGSVVCCVQGNDIFCVVEDWFLQVFWGWLL